MRMTETHEAGVRLRRQLRAQIRDGKDPLTLSAQEVNLLIDEVGRLQQSNERLRRQNKRLRRRLLKGGADLAELESEMEEIDAPSPDEDREV